MNLLRLTDARYSIIRETLVGKRFPTEYFVYISFENSTLLLLSSYRSIQRERIRDFQTRLELFRGNQKDSCLTFFLLSILSFLSFILRDSSIKRSSYSLNFSRIGISLF